MAVAAGLAFGAYMALADALLFRRIIPASQAALILGFSAIDRIAYFVPRAAIDELEFRLILMSALIWFLVAVAGRPRAGYFWAAIICVALVAYPALHQAYLVH
jgi:hypothetical protein